MVDSISAILIQKTSSIIINCLLYLLLLLFSFHSVRRLADRHRNLARDSLHDSDFSMTVHMKLQLVDDVSQARHLCEEFFVCGKEQIWWHAQLFTSTSNIYHFEERRPRPVKACIQTFIGPVQVAV